MQNPNENIKIIETKDGSHTLYHEGLNEHYHSTHGSVNEAKHVFIAKGLCFVADRLNEISILEVGFGTGLNAFLTLLNRGKLKISYTGLEPFPVEQKLLVNLNYVEQINPKKQDKFDLMHKTNWEKWEKLDKNFNLFKSQTDIQNLKNGKYDLIYFDAFAPRPQPEMWEIDVFEKCFHLMNNDGVLVTYCAKGQVRRNMQTAGFRVERLDGPPGKREMLRAIKS